jgi:DNA-binding CsgD family transcriptional regulator
VADLNDQELRDLQTAGVITQAELEILLYRSRGLSQRQIANGLGITRAAVRDREWNAHRKIRRHRQEHAA